LIGGDACRKYTMSIFAHGDTQKLGSLKALLEESRRTS
jgi:hypothetical protein